MGIAVGFQLLNVPASVTDFTGVSGLKSNRQRQRPDSSDVVVTEAGSAPGSTSGAIVSAGAGGQSSPARAAQA